MGAMARRAWIGKGRVMIDLYYINGPNSMRAAIALEECGLEYQPQKVDLRNPAQNPPAFYEHNPAGIVPLIVEDGGAGATPVAVTQSGAILLYLAERAGKFIPADPARRLAAMQWFMVALTDVQPVNNLIVYMPRNVPDLTPASRAYLEERFCGAVRSVEVHLATHDGDYLGDEISIADLALFPVVQARRPLLEGAGGFERVLRWADRIADRPGVRRALAL